MSRNGYASRATVFLILLFLVVSGASVDAAIGKSGAVSGSTTTGSGPVILRFAQITDAHLFDAGWRCSGSFVEREYQENLKALQWSMDEINRQWKAGRKVSFVAFTGDLGIANLEVPGVEPVKSAGQGDCKDGDAKDGQGPVRQVSFELAETQFGHLLDCLPVGVTVYLVPGNNDLDDEDPQSMSVRYGRFVKELPQYTHRKVVDLSATAAQESGYTLVGLNSAGFKPQCYSKTGDKAFACSGRETAAAGEINEALYAGPGAPPLASNYCVDMKNQGSGPRADERKMAVDALVKQMDGGGKFLVFTHEPDLQDAHRLDNEVKTSADGKKIKVLCRYRSTWLLTEEARTAWQDKVLNNPAVTGIFAGHFHASEYSIYGGPKFNDAVALTNPKKAAYTAPTYVTMPLAIKLQWAKYPGAARGMSFYTIRGGTILSEPELYRPEQASDCCGDGHPWFVRMWLATMSKHPDLSFWLAALFTLLLVGLVLILAGTLDPKCVYGTAKVNWAQWMWRWLTEHTACVLSQLSKLVVDGSTQSYSLSKLQFLLWTAATIFGYTYLWMAHSWVQRLPGLPDITGKFPWETLLAGGTLVASQVSQQVVGTKGGGPLNPQWSDLISAGGVIAPGRIQFLLWTLVAIGAYLSSILGTDPCTVHLLPEIPARLLEISGISASAYIAARSVSPPGPLLTTATFTPNGVGGGGLAGIGPYKTPPGDGTPGDFVAGILLLVGSSLSPDATVQAFLPTMTDKAPPPSGGTANLDGEITPPKPTPLPAMVTVSGVKAQAVADFAYAPPPFNTDPKDAMPTNPGLYTRLRITITATKLPLKWTLRLQNPDGKYAEIEVAMPEAKP